MKNYLVINGKRVDLTEEQIKQLGLEVEKKSPFDRTEKEKKFYYVSDFGYVAATYDLKNIADDKLYDVANYCTDKEIITARAKEEVLSRLLWRFSMENGGSEIDWNNNKQEKWFIYSEYPIKEFYITYSYTSLFINTIYFISNEVAQRAIDEIVIPFYNGELEVCKIWEE